MAETLIPQGYKITIGRRRTHITTYENLRLQTTQPIKEEKPKKIKPSIPQQSDYAGFNYYKRMKTRRERIRELGLNEDDYGFYLDLRKYGSARHAGFGLGFERCVMYLTGMSNIRDVIPFPRTVNNCEL